MNILSLHFHGFLPQNQIFKFYLYTPTVFCLKIISLNSRACNLLIGLEILFLLLLYHLFMAWEQTSKARFRILAVFVEFLCQNGRGFYAFSGCLAGRKAPASCFVRQVKVVVIRVLYWWPPKNDAQGRSQCCVPLATAHLLCIHVMFKLYFLNLWECVFLPLLDLSVSFIFFGCTFKFQKRFYLRTQWRI